MCDFFLHYWNRYQISNDLKKISLMGQGFLKLLTGKDMLLQIQKRACFWKVFGSERVNEYQELLKSAEKYLYPTFPSFSAKLSKKKLILSRSQLLGLLGNTLTANYEYSRSNRENLPLPIQIKLSKKDKPFAAFYRSVLVFTLNLRCWEKEWAS